MHGENECALLYLDGRNQNSEVYPHEHAGDSEIYIKASGNNLVYDDYNNLIGWNETPKIAGYNSPNNMTKHGIQPSKEAQVYFAFKRSREAGAWQDYSEQSLRKFLADLNFSADEFYDEQGNVNGFEFRMYGQGKLHMETKVGVRIDYQTNQITYVDARNPEKIYRESTADRQNTTDLGTIM